MRWAMWEDALLGVIVLAAFGLGCIFMDEAAKVRAERIANNQEDCACD